MQIFEIGKKELNAFLVRQRQSQFVQSWEWGELNASEGKEVFRYGFKDGDVVFFAASLYKTKLFFGKNYLYIPRYDLEPLTDSQREFVFAELKKIAKKEKAVFIRVEPLAELKDADKFFTVKKSIDLQPQRTQMLDLLLSEDELLAGMHQKTRYNIRLAEKKGVSVRVSENEQEDVEGFWNIMEETVKRDGFRLHMRGHYRKMLGILGGEVHEGISGKAVVRLFLAEFEDKIIAASLVAFFGDMAVYVHGASSDEHRNLMAPYGLQWEAIRQAKKNGFSFYDFYGVDESKWPGVTRFKKGFGGFEVGYPGTFDLVVEGLWYIVYERMRKFKRFFK